MTTLSLKLREENEFIPLKDFEGRYEIMISFPYEIYDIKLKTFNFGVKTNRDGVKVRLYVKENECKIFVKHRLIMKQFNTEYNEHKRIYHINGNKLDNHIENLTFKKSDMNK